MKLVVVGLAVGLGLTVFANATAVDAAPHEAQFDTIAQRCTSSFDVDGVTHALAIVNTPNRDAETLARVSVLGLGGNVARNAPEGFTSVVVHNGIFVKEGAIAVDCGAPAAPGSFDNVEILVPRTYKLDRSNPWR